MMRKSTVVREKSLRTQERILEAAERLFADKGFSGASMRDITSLAKVNLSVAYYYFKDKEALLFAVFDRYVKPLMDKQLEMLERARKEAGTSPITPRRLLEAMILPRTESVSEVVHQLFTMLLVRRGELEMRVFQAIEKATQGIRERFISEFQKTFPKLSAVELNFRIESVHTMLAGWTAIAPFKKGAYSKDITREDLFEMFMAMVLEMFGAPPTLSRKA